MLQRQEWSVNAGHRCCSLVTKSCPTLLWLHGHSPPDSSVHGIFQARILEAVAISFSRVLSQPKDWTWVSCIGGWILYHWATQFSSVAQSSLTLCNPMDCSMSGLPVHHKLPEFAQTHVHWVGDAIQPSYPLSSPSPPALNLSQHQGLFQWVSFFASGCQNIGVSASDLPINIQDCYPLGFISPCSPRDWATRKPISTCGRMLLGWTHWDWKSVCPSQ